MEIQIKETEAEMQAMLKEFMDDMGKRLTRKDAIEYANKLIEAKKRNNYKGIKEIWHGVGYKRFQQKDYQDFIKPLVNRDFELVKGILDRAATVKSLNELRKLTLPYPVVPPAFLQWKNGIKEVATKLVHKAGNNKKKQRFNGKFTLGNTIGKVTA